MDIAGAIINKTCDRKSALLSFSHEATQVYSATVTRLHQALGKCSRSEFEALFREVEKQRVKLNAASKALEKHIVEHGC